MSNPWSSYLKVHIQHQQQQQQPHHHVQPLHHHRTQGVAYNRSIPSLWCFFMIEEKPRQHKCHHRAVSNIKLFWMFEHLKTQRSLAHAIGQKLNKRQSEGWTDYHGPGARDWKGVASDMKINGWWWQLHEHQRCLLTVTKWWEDLPTARRTGI